MDPRHKALLTQAMQAAKAGDLNRARELTEEVLIEDEDNAPAWIMLARLVTEPEDKIAALEKALEIDPNNDTAKKMLSKLRRKVLDEEEVVPGVSRGTLVRIGLGIGVIVVIILVIAMLVIGSNNSQRAVAEATQTAFLLNPTLTADAILAETAVAVAMTETESFVNPPTATPTETLEGPPTLPPTFTPTFTPTIPISPTPLAQPQGLSGRIIAWGGFDAVGDGYLSIISMPLDGGGQYTVLSGTSRGEFVAATNSRDIIYSRYYPDFFVTELQSLDGDTQETSLLAENWSSRDTLTPFRITTMPQWSRDGLRLVFVARSDDTGTDEVFLYDLRDLDGDPITRLTNDDRDYEFPAISPDGTSVIVARSDFNPNSPNRDLYQIDIATLNTQPFTTDGDAIFETMPRFSPDGGVLAFVSRTGPNDPGEIVIRPVSSGGFGGSLAITNNGADDIYPVFSPDGRHIAFSSNRRGAYQIFIYDQNTGDLFQLTDDDLDDYYPGAWVDR